MARWLGTATESTVAAAKALSRGPASPYRADQLFDLGSAFCHVAIPARPLPLSAAERTRITQSAAQELTDILESDRAPRDLAERSRPDRLWRELAAANWDIVSRQEDARVCVAKAAVVQVARLFEHRARTEASERVPFEEILSAMLREMNNPNSVLARQMEGPLRELGAGLPHARQALQQVLLVG